MTRYTGISALGYRWEMTSQIQAKIERGQAAGPLNGAVPVL